MKRKVKMVGKNYDVVLEEGKKVITVTCISKDGEQLGRKNRFWCSLEGAIENYKYYGFVEEI